MEWSTRSIWTFLFGKKRGCYFYYHYNCKQYYNVNDGSDSDNQNNDNGTTDDDNSIRKERCFLHWIEVFLVFNPW